jgi:hypothetical protein
MMEGNGFIGGAVEIRFHQMMFLSSRTKTDFQAAVVGLDIFLAESQGLTTIGNSQAICL